MSFDTYKGENTDSPEVYRLRAAHPHEDCPTFYCSACNGEGRAIRTALAEIAEAAVRLVTCLRAIPYDQFAAGAACHDLEYFLTTHAAAIRGAK